MPRSVYQIKNVFLTLIGIFHLDSMTLDRDATLPLKIHIVEHLTLGNLNRMGILQ